MNPKRHLEAGAPTQRAMNRVEPFLSGRSHRMRKGFLILGMSILGMLGTSHAAVITAGEIIGIGGSSAQDDTVTFSAIYGKISPQSDGVIHMVLDLGSVKNVDVITFINRATSTNFAISSLSIHVAPDEGAIGFDPYSLASYTTTVFANQNLTPYSNASLAVRPADITDSQNRYFLINFTQSFHTNGNSFSTTANMDRVQFSDLQITTAIPEPSTAVLGSAALALAAFCGTRRRKRSQSRVIS